MPPTLLATAPPEGVVHDLSVSDLWVAFQSTGAREDRDRLVLHYSSLVTFVASRMRASLPSAVDHADLIQSGIIGLMDAVGRFEPARGLKFETFAVPRIRGAILDSLRAQDWVPRSVRRSARDLEAAAESCRDRLGRTPTAAELADEMGITSADLDHARAGLSRIHLVELDAMVYPSGEPGLSLAETLADPFAELPGDALDEQVDRESLWAAVHTLDERGRTVLLHSYVDGLSLAQIGVILGVSESRVCQIRTKALRQLAVLLTTQPSA